MEIRSGLQKLVDDVATLQKSYRLSKEATDDIKAELDTCKEKLLNEMAQAGIKSQEDVRGSYTATRAKKVDVKLLDEEAALDWLKQQDIADPHIYTGLKWANFKTLAKTALKQDGEIPGGCELEEQEYITIKENK